LLASVGLDNDVLVDSEGSGVEFDVELFFTSQTKRVRRLTVLEFEGQYSHTGQVASVDSFETLSNDGRDTLEIRSLGSPISGGTRTVFLTSEDDDGVTVLLILFSSIEDVHNLTIRHVDSLRANLVNKLVDNSDVTEGTSSHNFEVTSSGTEGVEVFFFNSLGDQVSTSGGVLGDLTSRGDVIGGNEISERAQDISVFDLVGLGEGLFEGLEEGRFVDISGSLPSVDFIGGGGKGVPSGGTLGDSLVDILEVFGLDVLGSSVNDFLLSGPDISKEDIFTVSTLSDGFSFEVLVDSTSQSVRDDEGGTGKITGSDQRMDSGFEVSVTGQDGSSNDIVLGDSVGNFFSEFTRVTDAGHATITSNVETELFEVFEDTRFLEVSLSDFGTGGQRGLDVWLNGETLLDGISGEETSSNHTFGVGGIGARSDGRDNDGTVVQSVLFTFVSEFTSSAKLIFSKTETLEANLVGQTALPILLHLAQENVIVGSLGTR